MLSQGSHLSLSLVPEVEFRDRAGFRSVGVESDRRPGVLSQAMYLAATAMGLAPCAIGGGDADLFARAAGTDYYAETSVGEFLLGSPRPH